MAKKVRKAVEDVADSAATPTPFKPRRGRPSATQVAAIDAAILSTARDLFLESGYANTSMEAVALSVGVSKGTLYSRYPNKSDLFRSIVAERLAVWSASWSGGVMDAMAVPGDSPPETMFRTGVAFLNSLCVPEVSAFDRLIMTEAQRFPEIYNEFYEQGYAAFIDQLTAAIAVDDRQPAWPTQDARSVAVSFLAALHGWFRMTSLLEELTPEKISSYVARLVALLFGGRAAW